MKRSIVFLALFVSLFSYIDVSAATTSKEVSLVRCVDGDTAVFLVDEEEVKFRFLAIDTPETVHPTKEVEAFGKNASEYTCNKLTNAEKIVVEYENSNKVDKYGRSLAWIWVDDSLLQKELISVGYGEVAYIYGKYRYTESLCLVQKNAKAGGLGVWSEEREEGYCSTINLEGVKDNIDPLKIGQVDVIEAPNEEDVTPLEDEENFFKDASKVADKLNDYLVDNDGEVSKVFIYVFLAFAAVYAVFKGQKKK